MKCYLRWQLATCMLMPDIISKIRFLEFGREAPKGSRFKGIITTESIIGFYEYTSKKEKAEESQKSNTFNRGLIGYTSRGSDLRTYTQMGWIDQKRTRQFKDLIRNSFCTKGNLIWDTVISLKDYEVSADKQLYNVDDYAAVVSKVLPDFFRYAGFDPSNMGYWMNYHTDKSHPHIHLAFFEKQQTVSKGELSQRAVNKFKSLFIKEMALRQEFQKRYGIDSKDFFKLIDQDRKKLLSNVKERNLSSFSDIQKLYATLPKSGRLSYNSQHIAKYRGDIDKITKRLLDTPGISEIYSQWLDKVQQLDSLQNEYANDKISTLQNTEMGKLYTLIGNIILQSFKAYRTEMSIRELTVPKGKMNISEDKASLSLNGREIFINEDNYKIYEDTAEIDLTQDEYLCLDTNSGKQLILDKEELIDLLKNQMSEDKKSLQPNLRMSFSGYHSKQVRNTFPGRNLNQAVFHAVAQQLHEKEHDLDVFLYGNKDKKMEV